MKPGKESKDRIIKESSKESGPEYIEKAYPFCSGTGTVWKKTWIEKKRSYIDPSHLMVRKIVVKCSDVNLAVHLLNDAWLDKYDCAVVVSNNSDLAESMRLVKEQHHKRIGLFIPGLPRNRSIAL